MLSIPVVLQTNRVIRVPGGVVRGEDVVSGRSGNVASPDEVVVIRELASTPVDAWTSHQTFTCVGRSTPRAEHISR